MLVLNGGLPLDYSLCCQTVTVYRREGQGREVLTGVYHDWKQMEDVGAFGGEERVEFTLIVPGEAPLSPGDKVLPGEGGAAGWEELTPHRFPGLGTVRSVCKKYFAGRLCHTEVKG